ETVKKFMEKKGFTFPVYISEYRAPKPFQTNTLPTTYLVSDKGHIVVNKKGVANWNSEKMRSMIDELIK
ncbi:MAG: hypothetical protein K9I94_12925, partial [Bacteroidales bacterium]|nr:hypothetical protein [Bacteroidales bacterium]